MLSYEYVVRRAVRPPHAAMRWDDPIWESAAVAPVSHFHSKSSTHHPATEARLLYDSSCLYGRFRVRDRYVLCRHMQYQDPVYRDACVEFFVQPRPDRGYCNFEMNACGALLLRHVTDPRRLPGGELARSTPVPLAVGHGVQVSGSLSGPVVDEMVDEVDWSVCFVIPLGVLEASMGPLGEPAGQEWRGNFYKCSEDNSHPHWGSWSPIGETLNFHQPAQFGILRFEG